MTPEQEEKRTPDQWKDYGDCSICRRKSYCKKTCSKRKKFKQIWAQLLRRQLMGKE